MCPFLSLPMFCFQYPPALSLDPHCVCISQEISEGGGQMKMKVNNVKYCGMEETTKLLNLIWLYHVILRISSRIEGDCFI